MTIENSGDTHHQFLEHKRDMMMNHLLRVIDTIEQRGQKVEAVVEAVVPGGSPGTADAQRDARRLAIGVGGGALAGAAVIGLTALAIHRATRPVSLFERAARAISQVVAPRPSPVTRMITSAVGSLLTAAASRLAQRALTEWAQRNPDATPAPYLDDAH